MNPVASRELLVNSLSTIARVLMVVAFAALLSVEGFAETTKTKKKTAHAGPSIVYDPASGEVLSQVDAGAPWYPASLTKLMTAYLTFGALKAGRFTLKDKITVSRYAQSMPPSKLGMAAGTRLTVDFALKVLLVRSTNDIAVALAEFVGGSVPEFAKMMNEAAQRLGMNGTYFANPHGLPEPRQMTTARDMALLGGAIWAQYPEHAGYFKARNVAIGKKKYKNRNALVRTWKLADGMKTGYICNSGFNLVASATSNGRQLVAVVLGAKRGAVRNKKTQELLEEGFVALGNPDRERVLISSVVNANKDTAIIQVPKDMAPVVCKGRPSYRLVQPGIMTEAWGIALGKFAKGSDAHKVVIARLMGERDLFSGGRGAVVRMPDRSGYLAMIGRLNEPQAEKLCTELRQRNDICQILSPEVFAELDKEDKVVRAAERAKRKAARAARRAKRKAARARKKKKKKKKKKKN
jgi:D-alanyl-D-alanine carboxypeptidase